MRKSILNPTTVTYNNISRAFEFINKKLFGNKLPPCLITLHREKSTFGYFCKDRFTRDKKKKETIDEIALNPHFFHSGGRGNKEVIATLAHEMGIIFPINALFTGKYFPSYQITFL